MTEVLLQPCRVQTSTPMVWRYMSDLSVVLWSWCNVEWNVKCNWSGRGSFELLLHWRASAPCGQLPPSLGQARLHSYQKCSHRIILCPCWIRIFLCWVSGIFLGGEQTLSSACRFALSGSCHESRYHRWCWGLQGCWLKSQRCGFEKFRLCSWHRSSNVCKVSVQHESRM